MAQKKEQQMIELLIEKKKFPSPLIIEGENHSYWIDRVAKQALCQDRSACGQCSNCKLFDSKNNPDWIELNGSIKMEELRDHLYELQRRPFQSQHRVFSISDFQKANNNIQNALLKTLEEPKKDWVILLGSLNSSKILSTIQSRCLKIKLPVDLKKDFSESSSCELFSQIESGFDLQSFQSLEEIFKSKEKSRDAWTKLLETASGTGYPGFWAHFAPELHDALNLLDRNLNPKILWEKAWNAANQSY